MAKSSVSRGKSKPRKLDDGIPMFLHATGRWAKKNHQQLHSCRRIADDPKGENALEQPQLCMLS